MFILILTCFLLIKNDTNFLQDSKIIQEEEQPTINCLYIPNFVFHKNGVNLTCIGFNDFYQYEEIAKYQIVYDKRILNNPQIQFYLDEEHDNLPDQYLTKIISSLRISQFFDAIFYGILNATKIESYHRLFHDNAETWISIKSNNCYWENSESHPIYNEINNNWKKVCLFSNDGSPESFLHYNDNEELKIKYINKKVFLLIGILMIVALVAVLISIFFIIMHNYKKQKKNKSLEQE